MWSLWTAKLDRFKYQQVVDSVLVVIANLNHYTTRVNRVHSAIHLSVVNLEAGRIREAKEHEISMITFGDRFFLTCFHRTRLEGHGPLGFLDWQLSMLIVTARQRRNQGNASSHVCLYTEGPCTGPKTCSILLNFKPHCTGTPPDIQPILPISGRLAFYWNPLLLLFYYRESIPVCWTMVRCLWSHPVTIKLLLNRRSLRLITSSYPAAMWHLSLLRPVGGLQPQTVTRRSREAVTARLVVMRFIPPFETDSHRAV